MNINKRRLIDQEEFDLNHLYKMMRKLLPRKSDCASMEELDETKNELNKFGIITKKQLRLGLPPDYWIVF